MFRLNKLIKSFGSIQNFTNWENDVIKASKPVIVDFMPHGVYHAKD